MMKRQEKTPAMDLRELCDRATRAKRWEDQVIAMREIVDRVSPRVLAEIERLELEAAQLRAKLKTATRGAYVQEGRP